MSRPATPSSTNCLSEESFRALERLYQARLSSGEELLAARAAFFVGIRMRIAGEHGRANGWLSRAQRLVEGKDCAETGYLLLAEIRRLDATGDFEQIAILARRAVEIGDRFSVFPRAIQDHITALERKGVLRRLKDRARGLVVDCLLPARGRAA